MESIPKNPILKFKPNTLQFLRNQYGFDTVQRVNDAIDILEDWASKQEHFERKSFDRNFLERLLIYNKGSVEKCKKKMDKLCTLRTLIPEFFTIKKINKDLFFGAYSDALLSEMTPDHGRVHLMQYRGDDMKDVDVNLYMKYFALIFEYVHVNDYCNHISVIVDWQNGGVLDFISKLDIPIFKKTSEIAFEGYSMRLKALHIVTTSKTIETFLAILKPILGPKLAERVCVHKTIDTVYEHIPKDMFPQEYGGKDKPISLLKEELYNELHSPEFTEYRRQMNKACTNEKLRQNDKFNEEYMGMSGTFRTMTVD